MKASFARGFATALAVWCAFDAPFQVGRPAFVQAENSALSVFDLQSRWESALDRRTGVFLRELRGEPAAIALIYSSCLAVCPAIVETMKQARALMPGSRYRLVLVSLDPERDTVPALQAFAAKHGLEHEDWVLLRGSPEDVRELSVALHLKFAPTGDGQFVHSNLVSVLNSGGEVVGARPGTPGSARELAALLQAAISSGASPSAAKVP